ncbi:hypothetical protein O2V63_05725 [Modestobacter sp. VKM Ac-2977]|uniref:ATP-binding protein n=1 Tax=Modestobacter sp. VKM Ac-2977 TaxID=3004131 RepID=UPI0022AAA199|nr:ATP-binding protein [Modestobacter sp. VKM Ac-2977]MCZ2819820.1 hypothetical protein [Modestobacter sp. VKM Ac-2977]
MTGTTTDDSTEVVDRTVVDAYLDSVRQLEPDLPDVGRLTITRRTPFEALREYVHSTAPFTLQVDVWEVAGAIRLAIEGHVEEEWLVASVTDDGPGFDPTDVSRRRTVGLASMEERAEAPGGSVTIDVPEDGGVRMVLRVPLTAGPLVTAAP